MFPFPLANILKQALSLIRTRRFLWAYGLFSFWFNVFLFFALVMGGRTFTTPFGLAEVLDDAGSFLAGNPFAAQALSVLFLLAAIFFLVMHVFSRAGIIIAIQKLLERKPAGFIRPMKEARPFVADVFNILLLALITAFASIVILGFPVFYLYVSGSQLNAWILGILALIILIPLLYVISYLNMLAVLFRVAFKMNPSSSIKASFDLIAKRWPQLVSISAVLSSLVIISFLLGLFVFILIAFPFMLLADLAQDMPVLRNILAVTGIGAGLLTFFLIQALTSAFQKTVWILAFLELAKPKKLSELEQSPVLPEVIS
jgi:hypothetical protein